MFSNKDLRKLIIPLVIEQLLAVTIGMADTVMVSSCGEAAVSGISLVDSINFLLITLFSSLATGGAVIASQYIGRGDHKSASLAAKQLFYASLALSAVLGVIAVFFRKPVLNMVFGSIEADVMAHAQIYFLLSAISYPFLAVYNAGAALFRSMGDSRTTMLISILMNTINIVGNAILIYGFQMAAAGAATASLVSRAVGAIIITVLLLNPRRIIFYDKLHKPEIHLSMLKSILQIGVPNGLENSIFQIGKILVASIVSGFGTISITANAVAGNLASLQVIPGMALGMAMITVVGQCIGAGEVKQARYYTNRLILLSTIMMAVVSAGIVLLRPFLLGLYNMSPEAYKIANTLIIWHFIAGLIWPLSFNLPNALRAAGDVKYTMVIGMLSMWIFRVGSSYLLGGMLGYGVYGVWLAMFLDWFVRVICLLIRYHGDKWHQKKLV